MSPPSTFKSPSRSTVAFLIVVMPVVAPNNILVPSPNTLALVTVELKRLSDAVLLVTSPPSIFKSPSRSTVVLRMVAIPVVAPITSAVAAPKALILVAVAFNRLNAVRFVVISPPSTFKFKSISTFPPTFR